LKGNTMLKKTLFLAASAALVLATPASAHRAWLLPSVTVLSDTNQSVTVDAATSTDPFNADHNAMNTDGIQVWAPDGTMGKIENAAKGKYRSTFDVAIDKPGTWRIGTQTSSVSGTFKVSGEDWAVGRRRPGGGGPGGGMPGAGAPGAGAPGAPPAGAPGQGGEGGPPRAAIDPSHIVATVADIPANATDLDLTESQGRNEFFVTAGSPSDAFKPTGKGLEMVPETHPTDLVSNEPGKFRFLVDGKPASGLKVTVIPGGQRYRDGEKAQDLTTDANGAITVNWPVAGFYWMNASLSDEKPAAAKATKRRMSYTATLEVVAP
jgi:uncharacterized GH25 family protein